MAPQLHDIGRHTAEYIYIYIYMPSVRNNTVVIDGHLGPPLRQSLVIPVCLFPILVSYSRIPVSK